MTRRQLWQRFIAHLDRPLLLGIALLLLTSLLVLYSADNASWGQPLRQMLNIVVALTCMWLISNLPLHYLMRTAVPIYVRGVRLRCRRPKGRGLPLPTRRGSERGLMNLQPSE